MCKLNAEPILFSCKSVLVLFFPLGHESHRGVVNTLRYDPLREAGEGQQEEKREKLKGGEETMNEKILSLNANFSIKAEEKIVRESCGSIFFFFFCFLFLTPRCQLKNNQPNSNQQ
jgi:hypothetical protein